MCQNNSASLKLRSWLCQWWEVTRIGLGMCRATRVTQLLKVSSCWLTQLKLSGLSSTPKLPALENVMLTPPILIASSLPCLHSKHGSPGSFILSLTLWKSPLSIVFLTGISLGPGAQTLIKPSLWFQTPNLITEYSCPLVKDDGPVLCLRRSSG